MEEYMSNSILSIPHTFVGNTELYIKGNFEKGFVGRLPTGEVQVILERDKTALQFENYFEFKQEGWILA
jgi:hypothetical protein